MTTITVIVGPQGSGKTTMARNIAAKSGNYFEPDFVSILALAARRHSANALFLELSRSSRFRSSKTVICDEITLNNRYLALIKEYASMTAAPDLIFTVTDAEYLLSTNPRRIKIIDLGAKQ